MTDEQLMLVGLARAYVECLERFGQFGQPTYMQFPLIQGSRQMNAVKTIAGCRVDEIRIDFAAVAARIVAGAKPFVGVESGSNES